MLSPLNKKSNFFICLMLLACLVKSQVNFVPNPGFEIYDTCPNYYNQISYAKPWNNLKAGGGCNPEFFHACANPNGFVGVPKNISGQGYQSPRTGNGYSYMTWFVNSSTVTAQREYVQAPLTSTLVLNKTYCVTYYANLCNRSKYAVDELAAYFDNGSIFSANCMPTVVTPQVKSPSGIFYSDTLNWMKVQGTFTASGTESYITIGIFKSYAATNYTLFNNSSLTILADYYIDDISVIDLNLAAYAGPDKYILSGDSAFIGRPPEIGLECTWTTGTTTIGLGGGLWVKPITTTTYVVTQDICGMLKKDTVTVTVGYAGVGALELSPSEFLISPNPNNGIINLEILNNQFVIENVEVKIVSVIGQEMKREKLPTKKQSFDISVFEDGIYFFQLIQNDKVVVSKKIVKQ